MNIKISLCHILLMLPLSVYADLSTINNIENIEQIEANSKNFTGKVFVQNLFDHSVLGNSYGAVVTFDKGARTYWHSHPRGQVLIVTKGHGYVQNKDSSLQVIKEGDVVICKNDTFHWHGASEDSYMTHIAISEVDSNRSVTWGDEVKVIGE